jgi:hypothetical protein
MPMISPVLLLLVPRVAPQNQIESLWCAQLCLMRKQRQNEPYVFHMAKRRTFWNLS